MKCKSGRHEWFDAESARRCCNGWRKIMALTRLELEEAGAELIRMRHGDNLGIYDGWIRDEARCDES